MATANRAYYTCYYCMTALLYTKNTFAKTHQGPRSRFAELFIKTNEFPSGVSGSVNDLFDNRQDADYDLDADITADEASKLIEKATEFLQLTKKYFEREQAS
ncbi:MAG: HEPN domain-containing protein [Bacteroidota bacterium]|nr:HEPN domain-containing protein [Bacteroidota bacterium]